MRMKHRTLAMPGLAIAALILAGGGIVAGAQGGNDSKKPEAADTKKQDDAAKKPGTEERQRLLKELSTLLRQRADLDRKIEETRSKLGENTGPNGGTGRAHHRFEFRNGNGQPQIFEFDGDGTGSLPPEARKQIEEAQKRLQDVFGNMQFNGLGNFDFKFDNELGPDGFPDMKSFQEQMQKFRQRMQRRSNGAPGEKPQDAKPGEKSKSSKTKTYDI